MTHNPETVERVAKVIWREAHPESGEWLWQDLKKQKRFRRMAHAALSALPPQEDRPSPKVRKLVWSRVSGSLGLHAEGYSIHADIDRCVFLYLGVYRIRNFGRLSKESLRSAKAAAQADYEARILGALE